MTGQGLYFLLPVAVAGAFLIHWTTLIPIRSAEQRLPLCRGTYLAFSAQLVMYSWVLVPGRDAAAFWAAIAMTVSFCGDLFNLRFAGIRRHIEEPLFPGILAFLVAQFLYIAAILSLLSWREISAWNGFYTLLAVMLIAPAVIFRLRVYNPARPARIMCSAFVYGLVLCLMTTFAFSATVQHGGNWWFVAVGAVVFIVSDAVMGETTVHGRHPVFEYQLPWLTYLVAQGLMIGGIGLLS